MSGRVSPEILPGRCHPGAFGPGSSPGARPPEHPRQSVDTGETFQPQRTIRVPARGDLQEALDRASPGDLIALEEGATYAGPFRLPRKHGSGWIVITGTSSDTRLPPPGQRVSPSHAPAMPKLVASSGSVIVTEPAAHHYRFVGIEFSPVRGSFLHDLVQLGLNHTDVDDLPHHIIFDRCYLHGDPQKGTRRGIAMNSREHGRHRLLPVGLQGGGRRLAGDCGMERPRALQDRQQFPRSGRRKRVVRRRRSIDRGSRAGGHRDSSAIIWPNRCGGRRETGTSKARSGPSRTSSS